MRRHLGHHASTSSLTVIVSVGALVASFVAGCDDEKPKAPDTKTAASSSAMALATTPVSAAPTASTPPDPPKKRDVICPTGDTVETQDAALMAELRRKLQKKPSDPPLKMSELANVRSLNLTQAAKVDELDPCIFPKLTGLHDLFLGPGDLYDLTPIANLNQLITLRAALNKVSDLKPLEKLVQLDRLDLSHTAVRDVTMIGKLVALTELQLDETEVVDISPLATCKNLEKLSIKKTMVTDVSPLKTLTKLKYLYIEGAPISDTSSLAGLTGHGMKIVNSGR